jgi:HEAT repeat protein
LGFNYVGLSYVYLGLATGLLIVIFLLSGSYVNALTQAITKRRLGESPTVLADPASLALLQGRLHDPHPGAAIYALTRLDDLDPKTVLSVLPELIQHPAPEVRREAFARIEKLKLSSSLDAVLRQSSLETVPSVKEYALRALGAISDSTSISQLSDALAGTEVHSLRGALVGSLKYHELPAAEQALDRLLTSPVASDRILAAQALADAERSQFHQSFLTLLRDPDPLVRREALQSASKSRQPDLFPFLIQACDAPETSLAAGQALITIGVDVFPEVEAAFSQPDAPRQRLLTLARVIGRFGGPRAQALLRSRIDSHDDQLRSHILRALSDGGFRQKDKSATFSAIRSEIDRAAWICAAHADLDDADQTALLSAALRQSIAQSRERVLLLLSFAFDAHSILRVREAWLTGQSSQLAYALEIIDAQLPADWKPAILPLLEDLSPQDQLLRLAPIFPQARQSTQERLLALIDGSNARQPTHWVRACAIFTAARLSARSCYDAIRLASTHSDPLIRDTARRALAILSSHPQEGNTLMLSTIEKVLILKTVDMFNQTPDDVLADVADLLQEMEVADGETVFKEGDLGDSLYVIVDGRVRVHNDERLLNYLGERDVFGEMALLDPEPRLASVTALEPTRLLRLDQSPFYQLIAERPEVATGIIRVLTRRLRDRVRDISLLDNHVKQLQLASN